MQTANFDRFRMNFLGRAIDVCLSRQQTIQRLHEICWDWTIKLCQSVVALNKMSMSAFGP
jgi:hypothetical protein